MALPNLANKTNPTYVAGDVWLKGWPVEYLYFKAETEGVVQYYVLELRIVDTADNRALDFIEWEPEAGDTEDPESYGVWVYPTDNGDYTKNKPNVTVQYRKDDFNEYIYATDYLGNGLSTNGTFGKDRFYTINGIDFTIKKNNATGKYEFKDLGGADVTNKVTGSTPGSGLLLLDSTGCPLRIPGNIEGPKFQKYADGTAVLDAKGRYLPVELIANLDDTATEYDIYAKTEFPYSGVAIESANTDGTNPGSSSYQEIGRAHV